MAILTANERLRKYIDVRGGGNVSLVEQKIGKSNGYIKNTKSYSLDVLAALSELFPDLNMNWLITGKGGMVIGETKTPPPAEANEGVNLAINSDYVIALLEGLKSDHEKVSANFQTIAAKLQDVETLVGKPRPLSTEELAAALQLALKSGGHTINQKSMSKEEIKEVARKSKTLKSSDIRDNDVKGGAN